MKTVEIELPDDLAEQAESAGLLSGGAIQRLLEDAIRRQAGYALLSIAQSIHDAGIPQMTTEEIDAEVKAVRAERRARQSAGDRTSADNAGRS